MIEDGEMKELCCERVADNSHMAEKVQYRGKR